MNLQKHSKLSSLSIVSALIFVVMFCHSASAQMKKIHLATMNFAPSVGQDLPNGGYLTDITREAFKRAGYELEVSFVPWKRAVEMAKKGVYDGVIGIYHSKEREQFFVFTDPIYQDEVSLFTQQGLNISSSNLKDLAKYEIGTVNGASYTADFDNAGYLNKETVSSMDLNIKKLVHGRIQLIIVEDASFVYHYINKKNPDWINKIKRIEPPLQVSDLHISISKNNREHDNIVNAFNQAFVQIKSEGLVNKILDKHGVTK